MRILLIEDDSERRGEIFDHCLTFDIEAAELDSKSLLTFAKNQGQKGQVLDFSGYDLVLISVDRLLGEFTFVLKWLHEQMKVGVISFCSLPDAGKSIEILALAGGADDHFAYPISMMRFSARLEALKRRKDILLSQGVQKATALSFDGLTLNRERHSCVADGTFVDLTVTEFLLLWDLIAKEDRMRNRDQLMDAAYGKNIYVDDRTIDSHIKRIRKKFRAIRSKYVNYLETHYGLGYTWRRPRVHFAEKSDPMYECLPVGDP